jgi:hypothetical protein
MVMDRRVAAGGHGGEACTVNRGDPWRCRGSQPDAQRRSDPPRQVGVHDAIADHDEYARCRGGRLSRAASLYWGRAAMGRRAAGPSEGCRSATTVVCTNMPTSSRRVRIPLLARRRHRGGRPPRPCRRGVHCGIEDAARVLITASSPVAPLLAQACPTLRGRTGADAGRSASPYLSDARQERRRKTGCRQLRCADQRSGTDGRVGVEPELRARGTHRRDRGRRSRWPSRCLLVYHVPLGDLRSPWRRLCSAGRASPLFDRCVDMRATRRNCAVRDLAVRLPKSGTVGC